MTCIMHASANHVVIDHWHLKPRCSYVVGRPVNLANLSNVDEIIDPECCVGCSSEMRSWDFCFLERAGAKSRGAHRGI